MAKNVSRAIWNVESVMPLRRMFSATATATEATKKKKKKTSLLSSVIKKKEGEDVTELYRRLSALGGRRDVNVGDTINEWVKEGKSVTKNQIIGFVYQLRNYKKYDHAIQLFEWLDKRGRDLSHSDLAVRLDLMAKAKGIESAEKYFLSLPESSKDKFTYGALLNCYCKEKMTNKAMDLLEKMKKLNFASTSLVYNNIISLHMKVGDAKKVLPLVQEMKEKRIGRNIYTYSFLMNSYALLKDIEGAERVLEEMKKDGVRRDWSTYTNLASIYVKAGQFDKANATLKNIEKMKDFRENRKAYYILIGLYSHTNNILGVERVWGLLKSAFPKLYNICHLSRLQALHRLGLKDELRKCFEEWESDCSNHDIRLVNVLIDSYLGQDLVKEAEALREVSATKGSNPNFKTLEMFMDYYLMKRQIEPSLKCLEDAASRLEDSEWKPNEDVVCKFLKFLEEEKKVDAAESLFKCLKKFKMIDSEVYDSLIRTYVAAGQRDPQMRKRMKEDGVEELSRSSQKLIGKVCPV